jgi:hypothetical protein
MIHFRALFDELLGADAPEDERSRDINQETQS